MRTWTPDEDARLRQDWGKVAPRDIGRAIDRSEKAVKHRASDLGIKAAGHMKAKVFLDRKRRSWTAEEDRLLRTLWGEVSLKTIARRLGRSCDGISWRSRVLGLHAPSQGRVSTHSLHLQGYAWDRLQYAINALGLVLEPIPEQIKRHRGVKPRRYMTDEQAQQVIEFLRGVPDALRLLKSGEPEYPCEVWGVNGRPIACLDHGGTDVPHKGNGLCKRCHGKNWKREKEKRRKAA